MSSPTLDKLHRETSETRFFEGLSAVDNWEDALDRRDQEEFDNAQTESQRALSSKPYLNRADELDVANLRESVFKAVFRLTSDADAAGYLSDDFGLIGEAASKGCLSEWIEWLLKVYRSGKFPSQITINEGLIIKTLNSFHDLVQEVPALPETGWVFVDKTTDLESASAVNAAQFYIAENELEEIELERSKRTLVECPTLADIISVLDQRSVSPDADDYLEGLIYYRENDDFME